MQPAIYHLFLPSAYVWFLLTGYLTRHSFFHVEAVTRRLAHAQFADVYLILSRFTIMLYARGHRLLVVVPAFKPWNAHDFTAHCAAPGLPALARRTPRCTYTHSAYTRCAFATTHRRLCYIHYLVYTVKFHAVDTEGVGAAFPAHPTRARPAGPGSSHYSDMVLPATPATTTVPNAAHARALRAQRVLPALFFACAGWR